MTMTHFGFREVDSGEKQTLVNGVFDSVAQNYDLMNDVMSFGLHRLWKREALALSLVRPKERVLDLASGSGDLAQLFLKEIGPEGFLTLSDVNAAMLKTGRAKMENKGQFKNLRYAQINAEHLPFEAGSFDIVSIGFGLRNVPDQAQALKEMYRVLAPGGRAIILEFSKPHFQSLSKLYDLYSFHLLPKLGRWIAKDEASYQYLVESIRKHPDQETLGDMMKGAGFDQVKWFNLSGGIVAVHRGVKF